MAFGKDVLGGLTCDGVAFLSVGVMHREEMVAVGVVEVVPVELRDVRVAVLPSLNLSFDFSRAVGIGHKIAGQVLVVVGTWVGGFAPFEGGLAAGAAEVIHRGIE